MISQYFLIYWQLCPLSDDGEFIKAFLEIYPIEIKLKVNHNDSHTTFLYLDIFIIFQTKESSFLFSDIYFHSQKMFYKRDTFNFHFVRMSSITSNIPSIICCSSNLSEFARFARSTLLLKDFLPVAKISITSNDQSRWFQTYF